VVRKIGDPRVAVIRADVPARSFKVAGGACNLRFDSRLLQPGSYLPQSARFTMLQHSKFWSPDHKPITMVLDSWHEIDLACWYHGEVDSLVGTSTLMEADVVMYHARGGHSIIRLARDGDPPTRSVEWLKDGQARRACNLWHPNELMYWREMGSLIGSARSGLPWVNPL
jgi:hypothetical protein